MQKFCENLDWRGKRVENISKIIFLDIVLTFSAIQMRSFTSKNQNR